MTEKESKIVNRLNIVLDILSITLYSVCIISTIKKLCNKNSGQNENI